MMGKRADSRLTEIFSRFNLSDFPVLRENAREINRLATSSNATVQEMIDVCQRDYGLTAKLLREANTAYYSHTRPVCSVQAAAGRLGLSTINVHLGGITVLEDMVDGNAKGGVVSLISKSFLSACLARTICTAKKYPFHPDEAFACSLLHKMGKLTTMLFLPDLYRKVAVLVEEGAPEEVAARRVLYGLSFSELGMELGRFWNLSEQMISAMEPAPPPPRGINDPEGMLQVLSSLSNALVDGVCESGQTNFLFDQYGEALSLTKEEALKILEKSLAEAKNSGKTYRQCLLGYMVSGKIRHMQNLLIGSIRKKRKVIERHAEKAERENGSEEGEADQVKQFFGQVNQALKEKVNFADFARLVLNALCRGIGLDSVLLASLEEAGEMHLKGRYGAGDIPNDQVRGFRYPLKDLEDIFFNALTLRRDVSVVVGRQTAMAAKVKKEYWGHFLSIFILYKEQTPAGLLILARKPGRFQLSKSHLMVAGAFRDLLAKGLRTRTAAGDGW